MQQSRGTANIWEVIGTTKSHFGVGCMECIESQAIAVCILVRATPHHKKACHHLNKWMIVSNEIPYEAWSLDVVKIFFKVIRCLTITRNPKKTSIWHTLNEKKPHFHPQSTSGLPLFFSQRPRLVQPAPKQIGGPLVVWGWKWVFFWWMCAKWMAKHL